MKVATTGSSVRHGVRGSHLGVAAPHLDSFLLEGRLLIDWQRMINIGHAAVRLRAEELHPLSNDFGGVVLLPVLVVGVGAQPPFHVDLPAPREHLAAIHALLAPDDDAVPFHRFFALARFFVRVALVGRDAERAH
jgi:hypothetical protein